jgi:hypothetical protein
LLKSGHVPALATSLRFCYLERLRLSSNTAAKLLVFGAKKRPVAAWNGRQNERGEAVDLACDMA